MKKIISPVLWALFFTSILAIFAFFFVYKEMTNGFVHQSTIPATVNEHIAGRISFPERGKGEIFDSALSIFQGTLPSYLVPDSIRKQLPAIHCNCLAFQRLIYFEKYPRELYLTTFDYNTGVIDLVFQQKVNNWEGIQSSKLDSLNKIRVRIRFINQVLDSMPKSTHFE